MTRKRTTVTLDDVAREAQVSPSTASRALNGSPGRVTSATQAKVRDAALRLGYATNLAAQATAVGRSRSLGLIVGGMPEDYSNPVTTGVYRIAAEQEMLVSTAVSHIADIERTRRMVRQLRGLRCSAVFVAGADDAESAGYAELIDELEWVERDGGRVVMLGQTGTPFDSVSVDDHKAGESLAGALVGAGYRELAVIAGLNAGTIAVDRVAGFRAGLTAAGLNLPEDRVIWSSFDRDGGYRAAGELLRRRDGVEAVFCITDSMAIGAAMRLREHGVDVGAGIGLAGCDDIPALRDVDPPLSTVHLPWEEVAVEAFRLLQHDRSASRAVRLEGYPVLRRSTPGIAR